MKILYLSPYLPHPRSGHGSGDHIYGIINRFSQLHDVTLVSFADDQEQELANDLRQLPIRLHIIPRAKGKQPTLFGTIVLAFHRSCQLFRSIILWQPYYVSKFYHPAMAKFVEEETRTTKYDIVQIEMAQMGQYRAHVGSGKTVLRSHDLVFRPAYRSYRKAWSFVKKWVLFVEWCRWAHYEPMMARQHDHVFTVTAQDRALLAKLANIDHVSYASMGMNIPQVAPPSESRKPDTLLFVGAMDHRPNADAALWLCTEIFPLVYKRCPDVILHLVGKNVPTMLRSAAQTTPSIRVEGFVDNLESYLMSAAVFVAPIRLGGGIKTKIVQAQSYGLPVVTTPLGAEGIEGANESTMIIGRTATALADGILTMLADRPKASKIGQRGRESVMRYYSWDSVIRKQESIYQKLVNHK